jgi:hypothetical protein
MNDACSLVLCFIAGCVLGALRLRMKPDGAGSPLRNLKVGYAGNASVPVEDIVQSEKFQEELRKVRCLRLAIQAHDLWAAKNLPEAGK